MSHLHPSAFLEAALAQFDGKEVSDIQLRSDRLLYVHTGRGLEIANGSGVPSFEQVAGIAEWLYSRRAIDPLCGPEELKAAGASLTERLRQERVLDFSCEGLRRPDGSLTGRLRVQAHLSLSGIGVTCRILRNEVADLDMLSLSPDTCLALREFLTRRQGLGLVTGPTGSGKSTTLAAMIDWLRANHHRHIVTIEDPIEYRYDADKEEDGARVPAPGFVTQQEVGEHVRSYQQGLRDVLRKAPHVILIGEIRDAETMNTCIEAAQTGHVVLSTLHTNGAVKTLSRILEFFPRDQQKGLLSRLSEILMFVLSQGLMPGSNGGRVLNYEFLQNKSSSVRSGIAHYDGEARSLDDVIKLNGNVEWDTHLEGLRRRGLINEDIYFMNRMHSDAEDTPFINQRASGF